jgi:hypothetical protein
MYWQIKMCKLRFNITKWIVGNKLLQKTGNAHNVIEELRDEKSFWNLDFSPPQAVRNDNTLSQKVEGEKQKD